MHLLISEIITSFNNKNKLEKMNDMYMCLFGKWQIKLTS